MILYVLKTIHILGATLWFAYPLGQARALKLAAGADAPLWSNLLSETVRRTKMALLMGMVTIGAGALLILFTYGGMKNAPPQLQVALALVILMLGCTIFGQLPAVVRGTETSSTAVDRVALIKSYARWTGVIHALWLGALVLMYVR